MLKIIKKYPLIKQILIFGIIGAINALIDFSIYVLLTRNFEFWAKYFLIANIISFFIANVFSFFMNKNFSFNNKEKISVAQYLKFLLTTIFSLIITEICLLIFVRLLHTLDIYGKLLGIILGAIWNFTIYKIVIFKNKTSFKTSDKSDKII